MSISPYLFYDDVAAASAFLKAAFTLDERVADRDASGDVANVQLGYGDSIVMLGETGTYEGYTPRKPPATVGSLNAGVYLFVDDVEAHAQRARSRRENRHRAGRHAVVWPTVLRRRSRGSLLDVREAPGPSPTKSNAVIRKRKALKIAVA